MIDALKEVMELIKELPQLAVWILIGLLFYKVVIIGSWFGIARLIITRVHGAYMKPKQMKPSLKLVEINEFFITRDGTHEKFLHLINRLREMRYIRKESSSRNGDKDKMSAEEAIYLISGEKMKSKYLHSGDVEWILNACEDKMRQEEAEKEAKRKSK